jgi:hypothetical protein
VGCNSLDKVDMRGCSSADIAKIKDILNAKNVGGSSSWTENDEILTK